MKLILISSEEEAFYFLKTSQNWKKLHTKKNQFWKVFCQKNWIVLITGIGLANASAALSWIFCYCSCNYQEITQVILLGCCGALNSELNDINDILLINKGYYLFADSTHFGYNLWQIPEEKPYFLSTKKLNDWLIKVLSFKMIPVNIGSSDAFLTSQKRILKGHNFDLPFSVVDMEATAILHIAYKFNLEVAVLKIISDFIPIECSSQNSNQYSLNINDVSYQINKIIQILVNAC